MAVIDGKWLSKEGLTYFWSKIKAIFTKQTETNVVANLGAKNLLKNARMTTTHKGVTFTINEDGSVTASGTNDGTGASLFNINTQASLALDNGEYMLSGCPAGGSATGYFMDVTRSPGSSLKDIGNGIAFTVGGNYTVNEFRIVISRDLTVNNLTFYPMIRRAEIADDTFEPYAKTNADLTNENENQQLEIDYAINTGAKNLFNINAVQTANHVTSSLSDGVLTVTSSGNWAHYSVPVNLPAGDYIFTTTISNFSRDSGAAATSVRMRIATSTSGGTTPALVTVSGNGPLEIPFTWAGGQLYVQYYPNYSATTTYVSSFTASNSMIRRAEITDITFQPYAPTNRELYETGQPSYDFIFGLGTALQSNDDLNNYNKVGKIYAATGAIAATISNTPWTLSGFMVITIPCITAKTFIQFLLPNTVGGKWYKRRYTAGAWAPWTEYDETQEVFASKTILPNNVDLNNIKTGGIYNGVNSTGNSAVHMPVATGSFNFVLTVIEVNETIIQIFKQLNSAGDPNLYIRRFFIYNSDWDAWYQFTGTQV